MSLGKSMVIAGVVFLVVFASLAVGTAAFLFIRDNASLREQNTAMLGQLLRVEEQLTKVEEQRLYYKTLGELLMVSDGEWGDEEWRGINDAFAHSPSFVEFKHGEDAVALQIFLADWKAIIYKRAGTSSDLYRGGPPEVELTLPCLREVGEGSYQYFSFCPDKG